MSVKKYGIYLAYSHFVDLRAEGLGRHLAEFLKGAQDRNDVSFVLACPSWMRPNLLQLFEACGIHGDRFEIIAPDSKPLFLSAHQKYLALRNRPESASKRGSLFSRMARSLVLARTGIEQKLASTRSILLVASLGAALTLFASAGIVVGMLGMHVALLRMLKKKFRALLHRRRKANQQNSMPRFETAEPAPVHKPLFSRLHQLMEEAEAVLMDELIQSRSDIAAWYSPTAFWPHFNAIAAPRLMCVPDVVLGDFPAGFAMMGDNNLLENFQCVEKAIGGGEYFVTYSHEIKQRTLIERYGADPASVFVIPHGANRLDELIAVSGFPDNAAASEALCRNLFSCALLKAAGNIYGDIKVSNTMRFLFYASQFRPNKNVISLLKAYEYLLRRRFIGHKLILTGKLHETSEVKRFIASRNLQNDVLCLYGLSEQELAACYRLADLAVNPSISEGGCPFTFTEALSVGTPVVMARIPVAEEIITDPGLQKIMFFDPYDWRHMADRIEWGLKNQQTLLRQQKPYYDQLAQRTWRDVVDEYIRILDRISSAAPRKFEQETFVAHEPVPQPLLARSLVQQLRQMHTAISKGR